MNLPFFIARRLQLKDGGSKVSLGVYIAVAGVSLSMAVMILAISIVLGFKSQIQEKVIGLNSSITVTPADKYDEFGRFVPQFVTQEDLNLVNEALPEGSVALKLSQPGVLKTSADFMGVVFNGYDSLYDWKFLESSLVDGEIPDFAAKDNKMSVVMSTFVANRMGLKVGDKVDAYFFVKDNIKSRKFKITGLYNTNFDDYDRMVVLASISTLQRIAGVDSVEGSVIEVSGIGIDDIELASENLKLALQAQIFPLNDSNDVYKSPLRVDNVLKTGAVYFNWLDLLDTNVVVILLLMTCVSGFTLVSSLFILILEKVQMIGVLKSLGATNGQISKVFILLAGKIVAKGVLWGNLVGLGACFVQWKFRLIPLDGSAYYLTTVPVEFNWWLLALLNVGVVIISMLLLIIPSRMISKVSPASTMRYE